MKEDNVLLSVENLTVEYDTEDEVVHAVNNVSFSIQRGETLGLVGETGAGKTTIAKAILRILPDPPAVIKEGQIFYNGKDLLSLPIRRMRPIRGKEISMIFQDPMTSLNPNMTIGTQIAETIRMHEGVSDKEAKSQAKKILEMVGIPAVRFSEYPHEFSGGMKQRVVIAIALACRPKLLLADEPTTALDVTIQAQILELISSLNRELQTSMIMITHDFGIIAECCDKVAVIYAGEIVEYGTLFDIFDHPTHPYTIGLFESLPSLDKKVRRLTPIQGLMPDPTNLPEGCCFNPRCKYAEECCKAARPDMIDVGEGHLVKCIRAEKVCYEFNSGSTQS